MTGQQAPGHTLRVIRLALLGGVLLFGAAVAVLSRGDGHTVDEGLGSSLRLAFTALSLAAVAAMVAVRAAQARAEPDRRGPLAIIGWAFGESVALFGGVAWLLAGQLPLYLTGVGILLVAFLLVPVPGDS